MKNSNFIWGFAIGAGSVFILLLWSFLGDSGITWPSDLENLESKSAIIRNYGLLPLGLLGLLLAGWRSVLASKQTQTSIDQVRIAQQGQYADRYAKAAAMLSDKKISVREAGIFALRELAEADPEGHYYPVQNLLCSFIRAESAELTKQAGNDQCTSEITEALRSISDLRTKDNCVREIADKWVPDLRESYFTYFPGHVRSLNLERADLTLSTFEFAKLNGARFQGCELEDIFFDDAELVNADFEDCNLAGSRFWDADLRDANFTYARAGDVDFTRSKLLDAQFCNARLFNSIFIGASLDGANFKGANLGQALLPTPELPEKYWPLGKVPSSYDEKDGMEYYTFVQIDEHPSPPHSR